MYACLDIGSNSFHLLVAEVGPSGIRVVERYSARVQLGEGIAGQGIITAAAMARGERCLRWFARHIRRLPVTRLWAVGTNALRQARNAGDFLQLAEEIGFQVDVVSGEQEAALVFAGVAGMMNVERQSLVIDIGGGSTELIVADTAQLYACDSVGVGCVSWRERFFSGARTVSELTTAVKEARASAGAEFDRLAARYPQSGWGHAYASSGTAKMLAALCAPPAGDSTLITRADLDALLPTLLRVIGQGQGNLRGLKPARRDLCLPGWSILSALMQSLGLEQVRFSAAALREGMLLCMSGHAPSFAMPANARVSDGLR